MAALSLLNKQKENAAKQQAARAGAIRGDYTEGNVPKAQGLNTGDLMGAAGSAMGGGAGGAAGMMGSMPSGGGADAPLSPKTDTALNDIGVKAGGGKNISDNDLLGAAPGSSPVSFGAPKTKKQEDDEFYNKITGY